MYTCVTTQRISIFHKTPSFSSSTPILLRTSSGFISLFVPLSIIYFRFYSDFSKSSAVISLLEAFSINNGNLKHLLDRIIAFDVCQSKNAYAKLLYSNSDSSVITFFIKSRFIWKKWSSFFPSSSLHFLHYILHSYGDPNVAVVIPEDHSLWISLQVPILSALLWIESRRRITYCLKNRHLYKLFSSPTFNMGC